MVDPIVLAAVTIASLLAMAIGALIATPFMKSAASELPLPEAGGARGRLDLSPPRVPGSCRALASPLAKQEPQASGRGHDYTMTMEPLP